jgi:uncharacterized protein (DUF1697 family)
MDALRTLCGSLRLRGAQTYIQSGNVVFRAEEQDLTRLATRVEKAIERSFGFHSDVVLRTESEIRDVIARNPFATRNGIAPNKLLVMFLASDPGAEARQKICQMKTDPEELQMRGRELYIYFPDGMGRSKLQVGVIEKALKTPGTCRNWNTVTKLSEMAEKLEAS